MNSEQELEANRGEWRSLKSRLAAQKHNANQEAIRLMGKAFERSEVMSRETFEALLATCEESAGVTELELRISHIELTNQWESPKYIVGPSCPASVRRKAALKKYRRAWELRQRGMTYAEIGERMGCGKQYVSTMIQKHERESRRAAAMIRAPEIKGR